MTPGGAVFLFGSARPRGSSTSESLGGYLMERLERGGMTCRAFHVARLRGEKADRVLLPAVDGANLLVLASPVYVDALPYLVTHCLERLHARPRADPERPATRFVAVLNCGLPGAEETATALDICRLFARKAGFSWAGGLGLGGGEAVHGTPVQDLGRMGRNVRVALALTAAALLTGAPVPPRAADLMARPLMPSFVYTLLAGAGWVTRAAANGALTRLKDRPLA